MNVVMQAFNLVASKGLDMYVDQAYQELLAMYLKSGANADNIRPSEIEALCYKLAFEERTNEE